MINLHAWQEAAGRLHAISLVDYPLPPRPDETIDTLCGQRITLTRADFRVFPEYQPHKTTCWSCDGEWRRLEGLPPHPALTGSTS
ncbi:zinc finger protein [Solihabitans fulvus]|nr:zinc finger protein [Solihabitans fulvus]